MSSLKIKFPNSEIFQVPLDVIAYERTKYYAQIDGFQEGSPEWIAEYKFSMLKSEIYDWIQNNMDWVDVKEFATKVDPIEPNYDKMWFDASFEIN